MTDPREFWSDNELLHAAMRGDNKAFALFCQRVLPKLQFHISQLCSSYGLDIGFRGDFYNDTILRALDYIRSQRQSTSSVSNPIRNADAWLKTIATNVVVDFVRKAAYRKERPLDEISEAVSPLKLGEVMELENLFDTLTRRERQVMRLLYINRLTVRGVAETLGSTEEAVRKAHARALQHLKERLKEESN